MGSGATSAKADGSQLLLLRDLKTEQQLREVARRVITQENAHKLLLLAAEKGFTDGVKYLCHQKGANVNTRNSSGETALHLAARCGKRDVADFLIKECKNAYRYSDTTSHSYFR